MARHGVPFTRIALGIVFTWFGALKFFPELSPAVELAGRTIERLSGGRIGPPASIYLLATWEVLIGLGLLAGRLLRVTLLLLFLQMAGTLLPLVFFPRETFTHFPYAPTLEGQYIIKNLVLITAALVVGATVRGRTALAPSTDHPKG
ncbi:MAG TPA: DoxX family membrane protein [Gemmatimonadales bacterium]|nr:DoxX family membrane protein [Gemmatimonadales bacterium]